LAQCEAFDCGKVSVSEGLFAETSGSCYSRTESRVLQLTRHRIAFGLQKTCETRREVTRRSAARPDEHRLNGQARLEGAHYNGQSGKFTRWYRIDNGEPQPFGHETTPRCCVLRHQGKAPLDACARKCLLNRLLKNAGTARNQRGAYEIGYHNRPLAG
jgi:hypothetical protein